MSRLTAADRIMTCLPVGEAGCVNPCPGHQLRGVQRRGAAADSTHWEDGILSELTDQGELVIDLLASPERVRLWHHRDLSAAVPVGQPVALHRSRDTLALGQEWISVAALTG